MGWRLALGNGRRRRQWISSTAPKAAVCAVGGACRLCSGVGCCTRRALYRYANVRVRIEEPDWSMQHVQKTATSCSAAARQRHGKQRTESRRRGYNRYIRQRTGVRARVR
jgi:hypothetical protein